MHIIQYLQYIAPAPLPSNPAVGIFRCYLLLLNKHVECGSLRPLKDLLHRSVEWKYTVYMWLNSGSRTSFVVKEITQHFIRSVCLNENCRRKQTKTYMQIGGINKANKDPGRLQSDQTDGSSGINIVKIPIAEQFFFSSLHHGSTNVQFSKFFCIVFWDHSIAIVSIYILSI